jgi:hypothetical protein
MSLISILIYRLTIKIHFRRHFDKFYLPHTFSGQKLLGLDISKIHRIIKESAYT